MNRHVGPYHCAAPSQMPPPMTEKCENCAGRGLVLDLNGEPTECRECSGTGRVRARDKQGRFVANTNENEDPAVGQYEYWARSAIRDLVQVKGYDNARHHIAMILTDLAEGRRS